MLDHEFLRKETNAEVTFCAFAKVVSFGFLFNVTASCFFTGAVN